MLTPAAPRLETKAENWPAAGLGSMPQYCPGCTVTYRLRLFSHANFQPGWALPRFRECQVLSINAADCREQANECQQLGKQTTVPTQRVAILRAMSRSWAALAGQMERLEETEREQAKSSPLRSP